MARTQEWGLAVNIVISALSQGGSDFQEHRDWRSCREQKGRPPFAAAIFPGCPRLVGARAAAAKKMGPSGQIGKKILTGWKNNGERRKWVVRKGTNPV